MAVFSRETDGGSVISVPAPEVKLTRGALQIRWKLSTGGKVSISEPYVDGRIDKAHFHKGLVEIYTVHEGWIAICFDQGMALGLTVCCIKPGNSCTFVARRSMAHAVYQPLGAVFVTQTVGKPVPNPERNNNDWYPTDASTQARYEEAIGAWLVPQM